VIGVAVITGPSLTQTVRAQDLTYSGSVQYATGRYLFDERTTSVFVTNGLDLAVGRLTFGGAVPVLIQNTSWITPIGTARIPAGGSEHGRVAQELRGRGRGSRQPIVLTPSTGYSTGMADPMLRVGAALVDQAGGNVTLRASGGLKIPLADPDDGFGTGAWDYGGGVSAGLAVGRSQVFADVFYWRLGDLPDVPLNDIVTYSLGAGAPIGRSRFAVLGSVSGYTAALEGADQALEVGLAVNYLIAAGRSVGLITTFGLTDTAADFTVSLGWRVGHR
jgi:hypothetical protein